MADTLVITQYFPPEPLGGAHRWKHLIENLPDDRDCRVVCPPPALPYGTFDRSWRPVARERVGDVPVTRLWTHQPRADTTSEEANIGRILNYGIFSVVASLYVLLNFWRYDTVVTVSSPHTTFLPGIVGKALGLAWVPDVFDLWLDNALDLGYVEHGSPPHRLIGTLERWAVCRSDHLLVITETMAEHLIEKYGVPRSRFTIVPFGVDEAFAPSDRDVDPGTVVYTGNMGEAHALRPFIEAFADLEGARLRLIGTGKRRDELESFRDDLGLEGRVSFEGVVPHEEVSAILDRAVASIVPLKSGYSLGYARPTKLLESMSVGTPFVASSLDEIERVADESGGGFAVPNTPDAIADALRKLLETPALREEMGRRATAYIDDNHRWPALADRVERALTNASTDDGESAPTD